MLSWFTACHWALQSNDSSVENDVQLYFSALEPLRIRYWLSADEQLDEHDQLLESYSDVTSLSGNENLIINLFLNNLNHSLQEWVYLIVEVDPYDEIPETDEENNVVSLQLTPLDFDGFTDGDFLFPDEGEQFH